MTSRGLDEQPGAVMLRTNPSDQSVFKVSPRIKLHSDRDKLNFDDQLLLEGIRVGKSEICGIKLRPATVIDQLSVSGFMRVNCACLACVL